MYTSDDPMDYITGFGEKMRMYEKSNAYRTVKLMMYVRTIYPCSYDP
jgi:hypothetical protein